MSSLKLIIWSYNPKLPSDSFWTYSTKSMHNGNARATVDEMFMHWGEITSSRNHPPAPFFLTPLNFAPTALTIIILPPTCFHETLSTPSSTHTVTAMNQKGRQCDRMVGIRQLSTDPEFTRRQGTSSHDDGIVLWEGIKLWQMSA